MKTKDDVIVAAVQAGFALVTLKRVEKKDPVALRATLDALAAIERRGRFLSGQSGGHGRRISVSRKR